MTGQRSSQLIVNHHTSESVSLKPLPGLQTNRFSQAKLEQG
ncbi:MAG: hypothetical protein JWM99_3593 [Verrucomicrobiales bacterium]|jgi:hypothetical protein|nr:hypothetical protein [Verrucomicrobiales bacterium]